ncbi:MAG: DEAD/DEAH box helicase [Azoarcus sp.]|jgi:hypothetical protein|nr:DEAD/DEAH box helicase [Azoarcus sp.]
MVDFGSLVGTKKDVVIYDLEGLYGSLDVKSTHTEPRPAQKEAMIELTRRQAEKDVVLKISTGAGKTTVGLLYLLGHMKLSRAQAVYLCPTLQLVEQVLEEASRLGIAANGYPGGETYPAPACMRGDAILVCTYEKLFNAKSTFLRNDVNLVPCAIVLDDAHAGAEIVRKQFTLHIRDAACTALLEILGPACQAYSKPKWLDIESGDPMASMEVPHWIWTDHVAKIQEALHGFADSNDFCFVWPYLAEILPVCRCVLGGGGAEIAPEVLPTHSVRPFAQASHRLFMSATLADDSLLTREFGTSPDAAAQPILPPSDRGLGERMILAPSLVEPELDRSYAIGLCAELAKAHNVVVLTSSGLLAKDWVAAGAQYFAGDSFAEGVRCLRNPSSGLRFAVFAQRYDGVDLPDDACRVLVIDGIPYGESLIDRQDQQMTLIPGGVRNRTIFRIEQGMGRAVRSHADFAVVLLVGQDLTTYVGRHDVLQAMTSDTRNQIHLSVTLAELVRKSQPEHPQQAIRQVIGQCLGRDAGWKDFYNQRVREVAKNAPTISEPRIRLASEERESYLLAMNNGAADAKDRFQRAIRSSDLAGEELGIYLQRLARIAYLADPAEGLGIQQGARKHSLAVAIAPAVPRKPSTPGAKTVAERFCAWFGKFTAGNAAVIEAKRIADSLTLAAKPKAVEAAIQALGEALGADSGRPERDYGVGPDNLWFWGKTAYVIEVKNENQDSLHKCDSGQMHDSLQWARENFPEYADHLQPLVVAKVHTVDRVAHYPPGTRVLMQEGCDTIGLALHQVCQKFAKLGPVFLTPELVLEEMGKFGLLPEQFIGRHTRGIA